MPYGDLSQHWPSPKTIRVSGISSSYRDWGNGGAVLLLHGAGPGVTADLTWGPVLASLADDHRVISVDMPGFGASDSLGASNTPTSAGEHLVAMMRELGVSEYAVIGHSRGSRVACEMALLAPSIIRQIVLIAAGSVAPSGLLGLDGELRPAVTAFVRYGGDGNTSYEAFQAVYHGMVAQGDHLPDSILRPTYEAFRESGLDAYVEELHKVHKVPTQVPKPDELQLAPIEIPVCLIWGREDAAADYKRAVPLLEIFPQCDLHVLSGAGHFVLTDRPTEALRIINGALEV